MKKSTKRILSLALALMTLPAPVMAPQLFSISESITAEAATYDNQTITISGVTYQKKTGYGCTWEDGAIAIKAANQNTITIQSSITLQKSDKTTVTVPVTEIGDNFASGLTALKTLTIPSSVEKIGSHVAYNCRWLSTVNFNTTKVEHLDSSFLYGSEYYDNKLSANRSTGHVWVGEWLLKYNPNATGTSVTVTSIPGKKQIKKIADQAFVACSPN